MRLFYVFLLFCFAINSGFSLKISNIRVTGNTWTGANVILNFTAGLDTNSNYTEAGLKTAAERVKERLFNTGWFNKTDVYITQSKTGADYRNIIIEVQDGFLYRFGGGPIYGVYGMDNAFGSGEYYYLLAGYNVQEIVLGTKFLTPDTFIGLETGNTTGSFYQTNSDNNLEKNDTQNIGGRLIFGRYFDYDFRLSLVNDYKVILTTGYQKLGSFYSPGLSAEYSRTSGFFSTPDGLVLKGGWRYLLSLEDFSRSTHELNAGFRYYLPVIKDSENPLYLALKTYGAWQDNKTAPDYLKLSLAGIDGVRSRNINNLTGSSTLMSSLELRYDFFETSLFSIFNISLEGCVFADAGEAAPEFAEMKQDHIETAAGTGIRIFFGAPVFVPVRLEVSWDKTGKFSFFGAVSAPF